MLEKSKFIETESNENVFTEKSIKINLEENNMKTLNKKNEHIH